MELIKNLILKRKNKVIKMPLCGFNTKMYGTSLFQDGLVEHGIIDRSAAKNKSIDEIFANEISEMDEFLREIPNIQSDVFREIIQGVTMHARGIYMLLNPDQIQSGSYRFSLKKVSDVLYGMDNEYYSKLETDPERMKKLVGWINDYISSQNK
jgi:hypothetical protein